MCASQYTLTPSFAGSDKLSIEKSKSLSKTKCPPSQENLYSVATHNYGDLDMRRLAWIGFYEPETISFGRVDVCPATFKIYGTIADLESIRDSNVNVTICWLYCYRLFYKIPRVSQSHEQMSSFFPVGFFSVLFAENDLSESFMVAGGGVKHTPREWKLFTPMTPVILRSRGH